MVRVVYQERQESSDLTSSYVQLNGTGSKRDFMSAIYNTETNKWYVVGFVKGY